MPQLPLKSIECERPSNFSRYGGNHLPTSGLNRTPTLTMGKLLTLQTVLRPMAMSCALLAGFATADAATSVTRHGITWTFSSDRPTGTYANGDPWVVGPVTITKITPSDTDGASPHMHGSMVNPAIGTGSSIVQAFDSRIGNSNVYDHSRNVARQFPFTLEPGDSLMSSESYPSARQDGWAWIKTIAILTVVSTPPPEGTFRPFYGGTNKTSKWTKADLDYSKLRSLPKVANTPSLETVASYFERPWIEIRTDWTGGVLHPYENQPGYGRDMGKRLATGLLMLQLNYSNAQKETLLVRLVQYGLDIYHASLIGANWYADGGHNLGRKMPMLLAGVVLNDPDIIARANRDNFKGFQEDQQTFIVSEADVARTLISGAEPYRPSDIGMPEWGIRHQSHPERDDRRLNAPYRDVASSGTVGHALVAILMGLQDQWNWPPFFAYYDRYVDLNIGSGVNAMDPFHRSMWSAYRKNSGSKDVVDAPAAPSNLSAQ